MRLTWICDKCGLVVNSITTYEGVQRCDTCMQRLRQSAQTTDNSDKSSGCDSGGLAICNEPGITQRVPTSKFPEKYPDEV